MVALTPMVAPVDWALVLPPEAPVMMLPFVTLPSPLTTGAKLTPDEYDVFCFVVPPVMIES